jgi:hypothetical protein
MRNSFPLTASRLALAGIFLALPGIRCLPTTAQAQEQPGGNLILNTDRSRVPGEPVPVIASGGPSADEAKRLLQQRIQEQSEGQITLFGFRATGVKALDLELDGKPTCAVEFEAGIEFQSLGVWASGYRGKPLTFVLLKPFTDLSGADRWRPFRIEAKGERFVMQGYALFTPGQSGWTLAGFGQTSRPVRESTVPDEASVQCVNHLKMIGLAFRTWALDNNDHFPFNVSTNAGGTLELCARGKDGFDTNSAAHFQVMSNELSDPRILVCPADSSKRPASSFTRLQGANVSYLVRSGTNIDETNPDETLGRCPIHGHFIRCDGSVKQEQPKRGRQGKPAWGLPGSDRGRRVVGRPAI